MMSPAVGVALATVLAVFAMLLGEWQLSMFNERGLRRRGAVEPAGDVYPWMRGLYPLVFVALAIEGALTGPAAREWLLAGLALFGVSKALKYWAIATLGSRWSFRLLIEPGLPLVGSGPYRYLRHPNYAAVLGEIVSVALTVHAPVTGLLGGGALGFLIARRIRLENRALGIRPAAEEPS
jgi:methyltransferase